MAPASHKNHMFGDVGNGLRVRRDEGVVRQNRIVFDFGVFLLQRIHFPLQFRGIFDQANFCFPRIIGLSRLRCGYFPEGRILFAEVGYEFLRLGVHA